LTLGLFGDSHRCGTQICRRSGRVLLWIQAAIEASSPLWEVLMRAVLGIVALLAGVAVSLFIYRSSLTQSQAAGAGTPVQTINVVGVKNDLLAIAQAERAYQVEHSSVASLDELVSSGEMSMKKSGRDGYTYDVESTSEGFRVTAHCPSSLAGCTNYVVDQGMEVHAEP
jgi:hypothetical protein